MPRSWASSWAWCGRSSSHAVFSNAAAWLSLLYSVFRLMPSSSAAFGLLPPWRSRASRMAWISCCRRLVVDGFATVGQVSNLSSQMAGRSENRRGRCSSRMGARSQRIRACSTTLANSRTLPGQLCCRRASAVSGENSSSSLPNLVPLRVTRCRASGRMSSILSRSGGRVISKVLMRNQRSSRNSPAATI